MMLNIFILLIVFPSFVLCKGVDLGLCGSKRITCKCGETGLDFEAEEKECTFFHKWKTYCKSCNERSDEQVCALFKYCKQCDSERQECASCPPNRYGKSCNNICQCQNGGTCTQEGNCICPDSFTGILCDIARSPPGICPRPPPSFPHGTIQLLGDKGGDLVTPGATIFYNCDPGFNLRGVAASVCVHDGTWSAPLPECMPEIVKCPAVEPIRAAKVTVMLPGNDPSTFLKTEEQSAEKFLGPFDVSTQLEYRCESNFYTLIGASSRKCMANGRWSGSAPVCLQDCGRSSGPRTPFVTHGIPSELGQWPWQVAMFFEEGSIDNWLYLCGGSLVNERWVATAAHCVQSEGSIIPVDKIRLFFGKHFRDIKKDDASVVNREIIIHPDYNQVTFDSDIALIQITAIRFTSRIQPICLPDVTDIDLRLQKGNLGTVTGWGWQEDGNLAPVLKYVQVPVVPLQQCRDAYSKLNISLSIDKNTICAGHEEGQKDACGGDSGGPLVFPINPHIKDKWVIEGIVSWGSPFACGNKEQYSGYTHVQSFVPWIKNLIEHE